MGGKYRRQAEPDREGGGKCEEGMGGKIGGQAKLKLVTLSINGGPGHGAAGPGQVQLFETVSAPVGGALK
jgi:hypothetical protein